MKINCFLGIHKFSEIKHIPIHVCWNCKKAKLKDSKALFDRLSQLGIEGPEEELVNSTLPKVAIAEWLMKSDPILSLKELNTFEKVAVYLTADAILFQHNFSKKAANEN